MFLTATTRRILPKFATIACASATMLALLTTGVRDAAAQNNGTPTLVRDRGTGPVTWVLLSGTMGGVTGMHQLETRLVAGGNRVVSIDAYAMSADSSDVSFAAMARRVDATLDRLHVTQAHVVGHAHGGGIALRLAASYPQRVSALDLLDVGALPSNQTAAMTGAISLIPIIARIPGGRAYIRTRMVNGIRDNSGSVVWFDAPTELAYTAPVLDNIGRATNMLERLGKAQEPEAISAVVSRIRVPVTVVLGQAPHATAPMAAHVNTLAGLGSRLRIVKLPGVGHFMQEEAPDQVLRAITVVVATVASGDKQ